MSDNKLKIDVVLADVGESGAVLSDFVTQEIHNTDMSKKADLVNGKVNPTQLPEFSELSGVTDVFSQLEINLRENINTSLADSKEYADSIVIGVMSKKADLVNGRVPKEQATNFKDIPGAKAAIDGLKQSLGQEIIGINDSLENNFAKLTNGKVSQTVLPTDLVYSDRLTREMDDVRSSLQNTITQVDEELTALETKTNNKFISKTDAEYFTKDIELKAAIDGLEQKSYTSYASKIVETTKADLTYVDRALGALSSAATKFYPTLALANADIANLQVNQPVQVGEVETGGLWYKATAGATTLTKSAYDPLTQAKIWATAEFANDILRPLRLKASSFSGQRFNKAIKSLSLRGDHNGKLISVAIAAYVDGVFTIVLSRPDSLSEQMSSSNSKIVARFSGPINFSGVQTLILESYTNVAPNISGEIVIDFNQLFQTDGISGSYIASDRLFDSRAIIDLNGEYSEVKEIKAALVSADTKVETVRKYVDISNSIIFTNETGEAVTSKTRFNAAIKGIALKGDYDSKLITLAVFSYTNGNLSIILARPDTASEVMSSSGNTKYVARFNAAVTFAGVQTLKLESYGNTAAEISGEIVIDFDKLLQTDSLTANYTASERVISKRVVTNWNGRYSLGSEIKSSLSLITGTDAKNKKINDTIEELVFFQPLPTDTYLNLAGLWYDATDPTKMTMQISQSSDTTTKGTLWLQGVGYLDAEGKALIIFDQGYAKVKTKYYYATNVGAAVLGDNATFETRGINKHFIKRGVLDSGIYQRFSNQFVDASIFHLPNDYLKRSLKLAIKGTIADTDYYLLNVFNWSLTNGKYRLTYQIKKMTSVDEAVTGGLIVYSGNIEFNAIADIKGTTTIQLSRANNHPLDAELEVDFTLLKYRTDNNNVYSPMILNKPGTTFANSGFDPAKLRKYSNEKFKSSGGLPKYSTLKDALNSAEKELFSIGGNTFKSRKAVPVSKEDLICVNNPPKVLSKKPSKKEYDFYYKGSKIRLEQIDSNDNFYFLNAGFIVKAPHPMKQNWSQVASVSASDFVVYDHQTTTYYSIAGFTQLFTATQLSVPTISWLRLTYDDELMIIATDTVRVIMFTENNQTSLRTFNFNGSVGTKYSFGSGVNIIKDWCMSHYKNVMFFSDYDSGVTINDTNVRGTTGGQKCYVSLDNGYTFTVAFDFSQNNFSNVTNASNITNFGVAGFHIHAVTYDPKQDVTWLVTGDGAINNDNSSFWWSRDKGQTWTHMRTTLADTGARCQMIMALPFDGCVAFGSDASNLNGMSTITYDGNNMVNEITGNFIAETGLWAFARSTWHSQKHGVKYISFGQDSRFVDDPLGQSFVLASSNGYTWEQVWKDNSAEIYGNVYCYDDSDGKLYISLDGSTSHKERVVLCNVGYM